MQNHRLPKTPFSPPRFTGPLSNPNVPFSDPKAAKIQISTSTVAALFSKVAVTGHRITMVDMGLASFCQHFHIYRTGGWSQGFGLKIFFSYSLDDGGRYFSVPCNVPVPRICFHGPSSLSKISRKTRKPYRKINPDFRLKDSHCTSAAPFR